jgi:hypothetical protein
MDRAILFPSTFLLVATLLTGIVLLLSFRQTRTFTVILLGSLLVLGVLGMFAWRVSSVSNHNQWVQSKYSQPAGQISQTDDANSTVRDSVPNFPLENQTVGQSTSEWHENSQISSTYPGALQSVPGPNSFGFGFVAILGLLLLGGLAFTIAMLSIPKTRTLGIAMLVAGSILILPIVAGLFWVKLYSPAPTATVAFSGNQSAWTTQTNQQQQPVIPLPPGYGPQAPMPQPSQSQQQTDHTPNSKELVIAYESLFNDYKTLTRPLKLEIKDDLKEKVGTLRINVQDIGQITISGSSFLINSIGQALAKAMTERMKEGNPQIDITPANSTKVARDASFPANTVAEQPASASASLKNGTSAAESPSKDHSLETAKAPIAGPVESAASGEAVSAKTAKAHSESKRPDWVGKPPFLYRLNSPHDFPDYYQVVYSKPREGDCYVMNISTGPYTTRQECEAVIPSVLRTALYQYVEADLGRQAADRVSLTPEELRQMKVEEYEETRPYGVGMMTQIHLLLNFDRKAKYLVDDALRLDIFTRRAAVAGGGFVALWLLLAVIWGYLKLDLSTKGAYRKRLRAAAGFAILIIVMMGFLVLRSLA